MINIKKRKHSVTGVEMLRHLASTGYHIFTLKDAYVAAAHVGMKASYVIEALSLLKHQGWIEGIRYGVYAFTSESGISLAPHDFEKIQAFAPSSVISYWTALRHYQLTQQIPHTIFSMIPTGIALPRKHYQERLFFVSVKKQHFFGITTTWINQHKVNITDLERTLLEGLRHPKYCGGFQEVLAAFKSASERLDYWKLLDYARRLGATTAKRLGWVLEFLKVDQKILSDLQMIPMKGYRKLDASAPAQGTCHSKWQLQENI